MEVLNKEKVLEHAKALISEGKIDRAIVEYRRLLDADPKDMRIKLRIAELLARQKKVADAVKAYMEVADSYSTDGFYLKAVTVYKNVLRLNPSLIDINYKLAELYEKMGLVKDAIHQYQILANSLEQKGDYQSLVDVRRKVVELDPHNTSSRVRLAETYQYQGMEDESLHEYEELVHQIKKAGKTEQLIELYEKILSYRPDNLDMMRSLCQLYYKRGEWKKIAVRLEKMDKLINKEADLVMMQAEIYTHLRQLETAKNKYKDAAEIYISSGDVESALSAYREILVISPDAEKNVREMVAEIDVDYFEKIKDEADKKRRRIEKKAALAASESEDTGDIKLESGGVDTSTFSREEIKDRLHDADAAYELGKAYRQMGLGSEAVPELEKSLDLYRKLAEGGYVAEPVLSRIVQLEEWLGIGKTQDTGPKTQAEEEDTIDLRPQTSDNRPQTTEKKSLKKKKKNEDNAGKELKKKKDKRVGFV